MTAYLALISVTFLSPIVTRAIIENPKKADIYALRISALVLFLIFALRAPSVGRDISGYKDMYEHIAKHIAYDKDSYWTETGYELLELFFGRVIKADWQIFLAFCSGVSVFSYYLFIKRYSYDPAFSLLMYIFMGYMVFDISAVRNMLSVAICLFVVPLFDKKRIWPWAFIILAVIFAATQIHASAYIFFIMYLLYKIPVNGITAFFFVSLPFFFFVFRKPIVGWAINNFKKSEVDDGMSIGGNVVFYVLIILFAVLLFLIFSNQNGISLKNLGKKSLGRQDGLGLDNSFAKTDPSTMLAFRMTYSGAVFLAFIGTNIFVRMAQYGVIFSIILLPNLISKLEIKSRIVIKIAVIGFLAAYFYVYKIRLNELDFLPYVPYWAAGGGGGGL